MSGSLITPTEALLQVAKQNPFRIAVRCADNQWSYAALWARVRQIAEKIHDLDETRNPVGLYMGLEIDYVAAAHAIWLSGRTVVFLSTHWTPEVLQVVLERADARLVLFGSIEPSAVAGVKAVSTLSFVPPKAPSYVGPPSASEIVEAIPRICSITPTSGTTGVPKSIVYPMSRSLAVLAEESSTLLKPMDGQWLRGGSTFLRPFFEIRRFMFNQTTLYLDGSSTVAEQCAALCDELESTRNSQLLRVHVTPSFFRAFVDLVQIRADGSQLPRGFKRVYWVVIGGETLDVYDLEVARAIFPNATIACNYACSEVGFAGVSQVFIRPSDAIPSVISFGPTHGCSDLVLIDDDLSVIPQNEEGATGIVGIVTSQSATHYLDNEEATQRMFLPWGAQEMLLYTDDIGCLQADGTIAILGRNTGSDATSTYSAESKVELLAETIASEIKLLAESENAIPLTLPLIYSGLNSVTMIRLYFWLQSEFEYDEEMTHLFEEDVTAEVLALEILGDDLDVLDSPASQATIVEDDVPEMFIGEKDVDYPVKSVEVDDVALDVPVSKYRPVSKMIVVQPPVETLPEAVNSITHRAQEISILSFLTLSWITPLLTLGAKRPLVESDLLPLRRADEASMVERWVDPFWTQLRVWFLDQDRKQPALFKTIFAAAVNLWFLSGFLWFLSICSGIMSPLLLQQIIVARSAPPAPVGNATALAEFNAAIEANTGGFPLFVDSTYALAGILMAFKLAFTLCGRSADQLVKRMALDVKTTLVSAVYKKALRLSPESSQEFGKGYIMNLVNVDCESISKAFESTHQIWSIPLQLIVVTVFLSRLIGTSTLASVGVLLFALFLLIMVVPVFMKKAAPWFMRLGDRRLKTIREIFDGIRLVKINGREDHFLNKVQGIRDQQLHWLRRFNVGVASFVIVGQVTNTLMPLAAFSLFGHENMGMIPASRVFPALSFFGMLVDPLISLPQLLSALVIATTSWGRVYAFLLADEKPSSSSGSVQISHPDVMTLSRHAISITDGGFSWTALKTEAAAPATDKAEVSSIEKFNVPRPFLDDINMNIRTGSLTAIIGHVGSGKSSLLSAIIGEMMRVSGEVHINGSIAYCAQQPWVQTSTIQDNILFGRPFDMKQLQMAIETTCFDSDLETFPHGMATQMTEKGSNLSGGQKARLALSRAVYSDADIYLFDDILAALDPRVGRKVFNNCIKKALHGKTRVLVTHQLQYLSQVDNIIVVSEGGIVEQGSYAKLVARNGELTRLLSEVASSSEDSDKTDKRESVAAPKQQQAAPQKPDQVIAVEERVQGAVDATTWLTYLKATGGMPMIAVLLIEIILQQGATILLNQWLTWWSEEKFHENAAAWIGIYDGIGFATIFLIIILNATILMSTTRASRVFHSKMFNSVLHAPMWWFESQPIGRIMNRFSKDIESVDQRLMPQLFQLVSGIGNLLATLVILAYSAPIMLAFVFPIVIVYWFVLRFYRKSLRELKRLESTGRGPLQSRINETLDGIPTIMAYQRETDFANAVGGLLDLANRPSFLRMHAEIWVTLRMEIMSSTVVFILAMLAHTQLISNATAFALALTNSSTLTYTMNLLLKSSANVEAEMNSVERIMGYINNVPQEDPACLGSDPAEAAWPSRGEIVIRDIDAAYHSRPDKLVLRNVNVTFNAGETVFIVGRTGSGKSTLLSLLLRMIDSSNGSVEIDGRDIKSLGVSTLRCGMEVIPQDPFIFSGTIRSSLDFSGKHSDDELWHALDLVGMKQFVASQASKLDTKVQDNGANYSVGQRQLLCLAAAILRNPKILLLDEATASIDAGSDAFIQHAMRRSCPDATILSVMHRLSDQVLEECDKVLVMEQGVPVEYASPRELLSQPNSMFSKLMAAARSNH